MKLEKFAASGSFQQRAIEFIAFLYDMSGAPERDLLFTQGWMTKSPDGPTPGDRMAIVVVAGARRFMFLEEEAEWLANTIEEGVQRYPNHKAGELLSPVADALRRGAEALRARGKFN